MVITFVPLTIHDGDDADLAVPDSGETFVADGYSTELSDRAICHRNVKVGGSDCTFISTRLMREKFALAFELFINVGHHFVDAVGVPKDFRDTRLVAGRSECSRRDQPGCLGKSPARSRWGRPVNRRPTSLRFSTRPTKKKPVDEKAKLAFLEAAFSDSLAIYMLSLALDFRLRRPART